MSGTEVVRLLATRVATPIGPMVAGAAVRARGEALCLLEFDDGASTSRAGLSKRYGTHWIHDRCDVLDRAATQLEAFWARELTAFELALETQGTTFQERVWDELGQIPYGETISYATLAGRLGYDAVSRAARAVGGANRRNRIAIVIPCHRVVSADASIGGYAGGIERKRRLLELEGGRAAASLFVQSARA
jgi:O-6-methylguanine DNA methyltransferase